MLAEAESRGEALVRVRADVKMDFFCGVFRNDQVVDAKPEGTLVFACGVILEPPVLARLANLDIALFVDVH